MGVPGLQVQLGFPGRARAARREPGDDFFCVRYQIWYPSFDCAIRTQHRTAPGCLDCEQGRFNLKRHQNAVQRMRFPLDCRG